MEIKVRYEHDLSKNLSSDRFFNMNTIINNASFFVQNIVQLNQRM